MCFNSSKSSSAQQQSTINRDERIALDGGSDALVLKDIAGGRNATANLNLNITDASGEVLAVADNFLSGALGIVEGALTGAGEIFSGTMSELLDFASANADRNTQFAASTQAAYASAVRDEMTNDLTQVIEKGMTTLAIIVGLYVAMQVLK